MRKLFALFVVMALALVAAAPAAFGANAQAVIDCSINPDPECIGTNASDLMLEARFTDVIYGNRGPDSIRADRYYGDTDTIFAGRGQDSVRADDGDNRDRVDCGRGIADFARVDPGDIVLDNCEDVEVDD